MIMIVLVLDVLMLPGALLGVWLLARRGWPLWKSYALCVGAYLLYANISMRVLFGGFFPSSYVLGLVTFAVDRAILWHHHLPTTYSGHTEREVNAMMAWYPVLVVLVVPTFLSWAVARRRSSRGSRGDSLPRRGRS